MTITNLSAEPETVTNIAASILNWFERAMPTPTDKNRIVQLGVHYEEQGEAMAGWGDFELADELKERGAFYKLDGGATIAAVPLDPLEFLDGLMDTIVTAIGTAYVNGFDVLGALASVDRNNWDKFVDGHPVFNENGKIIKPAGHTKVDLTPFLTRK